MGNFTAQKVYQDITNRQSAQKPVQSNGGNGFGGGSGGAKKPMTLAEHDKLVHGGHYDGGRCKFRQQLAAKGMLPPNSGAGNGGASVGGGQMSLGDRVRQIGANAKNAIRGGMEKVEGAAKEVGGAVKSAVANVHEKAEQLSKKLAEAEGQTEKSSSNLEKMGQILGGIKSPEIKEKAAAICKKVVNAINSNGGEHNGTNQSNVKIIPEKDLSSLNLDFDKNLHFVISTNHDGVQSILKDGFKNESQINGTMSLLRDESSFSDISNRQRNKGHTHSVIVSIPKSDVSNLKTTSQAAEVLMKKYKGEIPTESLHGIVDISQPSSGSGQSQVQPEFSPKTHEDVDKWFNDESDKLEGMHKRGEISDDEYNSRVDELESKNDSYRDSLNKQGVKSKEDMSDLSDKNNDNASPRRKNLRDALREHLASKVDNNTATEKDDEDAEYMDAHSANESMFKRGRISEEEFKKHRKEINDDYMKKQFARKFGVNYKPYSPQNKTNNGGGASNKNGRVDELTKNRQHLQEMLSIFHTAFGRNSVVGKLASGVVANKVSDIDAEIAKMGHLSKNTSKQSKQSQGGSGSIGPVDTPKQSGGLRSIHGEINHGGNAEVQSLIDQMEDEYRNAKKSSEKIRIMSSYKKLKDMYEPKSNEPKTTKSAKAKKEVREEVKEQSDDPIDKFPKFKKELDRLSEYNAMRYHMEIEGRYKAGKKMEPKDRIADRYLAKKYGLDPIIPSDDDEYHD